MDKYKIFCYKIWWEGKDDLYVGSTKQALSMRMCGHRRDCRIDKQYKLYKTMRINGYDFRYVLLESYMISYREEQLKWEQYWIDKISPNLNMYRSYRSPEYVKEIVKQYQEDHKDEIKIYKKQYQRDHKDEIKVKDKIRREKNIDEIRARKKIVIECECKMIVNKNHLSRHKRTKKHNRNLNLFYLNLLPFTS